MFILVTSKDKCIYRVSFFLHISGETEELGKFTIKFPEENSGKKSRYHTATTKAEGLHKIKDAAFMQMQVREEGPKGKENYLYYLTDAPSRIDSKKAKSDVIFHQVKIFAYFYCSALSFGIILSLLIFIMFSLVLVDFRKSCLFLFRSLLSFRLKLTSFSKAEVGQIVAAC